jgi:hypothetical protein
MDVLAHAAAVIIEPEVRERLRESEIGVVWPPSSLPGVPWWCCSRISTGVRVGAEALSRFPADWRMAPDVCFAETHSIGVGDRLAPVPPRRPPSAHRCGPPAPAPDAPCGWARAGRCALSVPQGRLA